MNEQKVMKRQLIKNMLFNLIVFTVIFTIFGCILYQQVSTSLYSSVDKELKDSKQRIGIQDKGIPKKGYDTKKETQDVPTEELPSQPSNNALDKMRVSPRLIYILRDEAGNIINQESIGRFYDEYVSQVDFSKDNLDTIYNISINNTYQYRGIIFKTSDENNQTRYVQLLANVDSEQAILDNFFRILIIGTAVTIAFCIIASYLLSQKTLKPITDSWHKQVEFVQNASHELRTPLTIIQTKQELLLQEPESKIIEKSEDIMLTLKETRRLTKLIKDLMILARADSNHVQLSKENTNIDALIKEVAVPYMDFANIEEKEISLNLHFQKDIRIDKNRIHELLVILLDNAIKYTEKGDNIEINTYAKESKCIIEVKDTGIGISQKGMKYIFDRFYREDKARSRQTGGTGLGLSIAHWIATAHKGTIKVEHNNPKGSIFIIKLPK